MKRLVAVLVLGITAASIPALAAPALAGYEGDVIIGQEVVLRIRFPAGGLSVKQRADLVTERINNVLGSEPFNPSDVKTGIRNKEYVVLIGDKVIITADKRTAEFNKSKPEQLANIWAANLRRVIPKAKAQPTGAQST
ncbi:MAG TPA: hypothetical protein VMX94_04520 [Armatimonadota bacterium]|nr:hypothetical protein [Armatimonadota bacterium]